MSTLRDVLARLPEIKARAEKATPGPLCCMWVGGGRDAILVREASTRHHGTDSSGVMEFASKDGRPNAVRDGQFFASARTDVPDLVAALEEARELLAHALGWMEHDRTCGTDEPGTCGLCRVREALKP